LLQINLVPIIDDRSRTLSETFDSKGSWWRKTLTLATRKVPVPTEGWPTSHEALAMGTWN